MSTSAGHQGFAANADTPGGWDARAYERNARFVSDLGLSLVDWLAPQPGERVLDLGCGDGALTGEIARRGASVLGVDSSAEFVAATTARGLEAVQGDGQRLGEIVAIDGRFDAVFSNAAIHWMKRDPQAVIDGVYARLLPGGRFVAELGGAGNVAPIQRVLRDKAKARGHDPDMLDPWYFPEEKTYLKQMEKSGFSIKNQEFFERPTPLPGPIEDWLETLARPFVHAFAQGRSRRNYVRAVAGRLDPLMRVADNQWTAPYVRLRFIALKPTPKGQR